MRWSHARPTYPAARIVFKCPPSSLFRPIVTPDLMQNFCPENIPAVVSTFRSTKEVPVLNGKHWDGGQCRIYKVDFSGGRSWSVRIPTHAQGGSQQTVISILQGERNVLEDIGRKKFHWAPEHQGSDLTFGNSVGFPLLALSWIEGSPFFWTPTYPPRPVRNKVLGQIAAMQVSLIECTKENSKSGTLSESKHLPGIVGGAGAATKFFSRLKENKLRRVSNGQLPHITEQDCLNQERLLRQALHPDMEHAPFAMDHGDPGPLNIIVDSDHNVMG